MHRIMAAAVVAAGFWVSAQAGEDALVSGPQAGKTLPGPFDTLTINSNVVRKLVQEIAQFKEDYQKDLEEGKKEAQDELRRLEKKLELARNIQHCLVCDFGLNPVVMVFVREPGQDKDAGLNTLLAKLDEIAPRHQAVYFESGVIFLSPDARSSANSEETDPGKLVEEALARTQLIKRLEERAKSLKHVVVAQYPLEGPPKWDISPKAEATVVFYHRHRVLKNWAFAEGKMTAEAAEAIVKEVDESLTKLRKK